jgi:hypothetical protein
MMTEVRTTNREFVEKYLMARKRLDPEEHGVPLGKDEFVELMLQEFNEFIPDGWTLDELLLRPRMALAFCDRIKIKHGWIDLPDDVILRPIMNHRKQAN